MNIFAIPWLELGIALPAVGAALAWTRPTSSARRQIGGAMAALALLCAILAWLGHGRPDSTLVRSLFEIDRFSAPLLPLVALLHFLAIVSMTGPLETRRTIPIVLAGETVLLATFALKSPVPLAAALVLGWLLPYLDLRDRRQPSRVYLLHAAAFAIALVPGVLLLEIGAAPILSAVPLLLAILIRSGTAPFHLWVGDLFGRASWSVALLAVAPLSGVYAAVRLLIPTAPDGVLQLLGLLSLATAILAAGLSAVQTDARRFMACQIVSHSAMVMVGLQLNTPISFTGTLCLWYSVSLSLAGQALILRALEARFDRIDMTDYRGLYDLAPTLAVGFLLTGLGSVGFPGTLGFVAAEMLAGGAVGASPAVGTAMILAAAINGIAVIRAYFLLFTGGRHFAGVPLGATARERFAVLVLAGLILGGGLYPQPGVESRQGAAEELLRDREARLGTANH